MNYKEVEFRPYDAEHNSFNCADGELEGWGGRSLPEMDVSFEIEEGKIVAVHAGRVIVYHDGKLTWAFAAEGVLIREADLMEIAEMPEPASLALMGDTLVTASVGGLLYHRWNGSGYDTLPQLPQLPRIEFGLLKAGEMADTCSLIMPLSMVPEQNGDGMTDPHPSANNTGSEDASGFIDKVVDTIISRAHGDKRSRGYFTSPFFVRYALRDRVGRCLCVSPPVLMAGNVLPPCMEIMYTAKNEKEATMHARLNGSPYFSLMARACPLPEAWLSVVKSVDIYVSPQIPAWSAGAGYLCSYADVLGQLNSGGGHRGRGNSATLADTMFAGHYSADGINYIDHFTDPSLRRTQVWYVSPNVGLASEIVSEHRFFRIASLAPDRLASMADFTPLPVDTTATPELESFEQLPDAPESAAVCPEVLATLNGRLVAAGGSYGIPRPVDPAISAAFSGNTASDASSSVEISVYTRAAGELRRVSESCHSVIDFSVAFPRYIYHPDGEARTMTIDSGGVLYRLPLSRHPFLPGVFWFGGIGKDYAPEPAPEPLPAAPAGGSIPCPGRVWLSSPRSPCHFDVSQGIEACNSSIRAVSAAVVTPDLSCLGRYPVYVFADDGVWLMEYDSDRLRICGSHRISSEICVSARAVAQADEGVVFATDHSLMIASGSKVRQLISLRSLSIPLLPRLPDWLEPAAPEGSVRNPVLAYDGATSTLIVADRSSGLTYLCDITSRTAALWGRRAISLPSASGRPLIQTDRREAGYLSPYSSSAAPGYILTRPIKLTKAFIPKIIRSVTLWHSGAPDSVCLKVYGANSLSSWHLVASSACHRAELASRSPWRFLRIAAISAHGLTEIYGAQIEFEY